nr:hypothetical protein [Mycoplasmopsis bovis]
MLAGKAAEAVGRNPEAASKIRTMMLVGQAVSESACYLCISYINSINVCF